MVDFLVTMAVAFIGGLLAKRLKLPAPGLVGAIICVVVYNLTVGKAYFPSGLSFYVRIISGYYIGSTITVEKLKVLKNAKLAAPVMLVSILVTSLMVGTVVYLISGLDAATVYYATAPGGINEMSLLAMDMGGQPSKVAAVQVLRLSFTVSVIPIIIKSVSGRLAAKHPELLPTPHDNETENKKREKTPWYRFFLVLAVAYAFAKVFNAIGVPSAAMLGSLTGTVVMCVLKQGISLPKDVKFFVQVFSGAYIGQQVTKSEVAQLGELVVPIIVMLILMVIVNFIQGYLTHKLCKCDLLTGLYATAPGGISDISLIANDVGADGTLVTAFHIVRILAVVVCYPVVVPLLAQVISNSE